MRVVSLDIAALNPAFKAHARRGIGRYVQELHAYFEKQQPEDFQIRTFSSFEVLHQSRLGKYINYAPFGRSTLRQQLLGPFMLSAEKAQFLHFPAHIDAPAWCPRPYIVTLMDLIPLIFKDLYKVDNPSWRFHLARWLEVQAIKRASLVLCISENTAKDAQRMLGIKDEKLLITPLGVDPKFFRAERPVDEDAFRMEKGLPLDAPIIFYLGGIDQRKNTRGLIAVFKRVREHFMKSEQAAPILVIAGNVQSDDQYSQLENIIRNEALGDAVYFPGFVADEELLVFFKISKAFFFPSFYEGFGLPPLEAMAAGLPVLSSNRSAMPEVLGDAAVLVNPSDIREAATALIRILSDGNFAADLSEKGKKRAMLFSWEKTGLLTIEAYRKLLQRV